MNRTRTLVFFLVAGCASPTLRPAHVEGPRILLESPTEPLSPASIHAVAHVQVGVHHIYQLWTDPVTSLVVELDANAARALESLLPAGAWRAHRRYLSTGTPDTPATLDVDPRGLGFLVFPLGQPYRRGGDYRSTPRIVAWLEVADLRVDQGFLLVRTRGGELVNVGLTVHPDLEPIVLAGLRAYRDAATDTAASACVHRPLPSGMPRQPPPGENFSRTTSYVHSK